MKSKNNTDPGNQNVSTKSLFESMIFPNFMFAGIWPCSLESSSATRDFETVNCMLLGPWQPWHISRIRYKKMVKRWGSWCHAM